MAEGRPIEYAEAGPEVRAVFDDIKRTRNIPDVNNFWKVLAHDPRTLKRTWESLKEVMAPGALDPLTKEMLYLAVSVAHNCEYCIASHTARLRSRPNEANAPARARCNSASRSSAARWARSRGSRKGPSRRAASIRRPAARTRGPAARVTDAATTTAFFARTKKAAPRCLANRRNLNPPHSAAPSAPARIECG